MASNPILDIRCPACRRLLGRRRPGVPSIEVAKQGQVLAVINEGTLNCECGAAVHVHDNGRRIEVALA